MRDTQYTQANSHGHTAHRQAATHRTQTGTDTHSPARMRAAEATCSPLMVGRQCTETVRPLLLCSCWQRRQATHSQHTLYTRTHTLSTHTHTSAASRPASCCMCQTACWGAVLCPQHALPECVAAAHMHPPLTCNRPRSSRSPRHLTYTRSSRLSLMRSSGSLTVVSSAMFYLARERDWRGSADQQRRAGACAPAQRQVGYQLLQGVTDCRNLPDGAGFW